MHTRTFCVPSYILLKITVNVCCVHKLLALLYNRDALIPRGIPNSLVDFHWPISHMQRSPPVRIVISCERMENKRRYKHTESEELPMPRPFLTLHAFNITLQWNPYNADTLENKRSVLIIGVSTFQRYSLYAHMVKQSCSMHEKVSK